MSAYASLASNVAASSYTSPYAQLAQQPPLSQMDSPYAQLAHQPPPQVPQSFPYHQVPRKTVAYAGSYAAARIQPKTIGQTIANVSKEEIGHPYPSFEIIRPVCRCGLEHSQEFYSYVAEDSFKEFSNDLVKHFGRDMAFSETEMKLMGFRRNRLTTAKEIEGYKSCCLMNLRSGMQMSVSVFQTDRRMAQGSQAISERRYPEALPGPSNRVETLYWAY
jgi:hypothetical protein